MQKPARRRAGKVVSMPSHDVNVIHQPLDRDEVARRAFERYCARGCEDGHDLDDWLSAEREFRAAVDSTAA